MQWASRLIAVPVGKTTLEQTLARERRKVIADRYILPLMGVLFWTLLLAIGLFVLGFLIQLWELALSFNGRAPILVIGGVFATGLSLIILGVIVITTVHAALHDNSPFESPLSNAMQPLLRWVYRREAVDTEEDAGIDKHQHDDADSWDLDEHADTAIGRDVEGLLRWDDNDNKETLTLKTYARLVLHTNDTEVLERAVPSFEFRKWKKAGDKLFPVFRAVWDRFLATDTSFRVKETASSQLVHFKDWHVRRDRRGRPPDYLTGSVLTRWCIGQSEALVRYSRVSRRQFFPSWAFFTSLEENNSDLLGHEPDSYEDCVADILGAYYHNRELGDRFDLFKSAITECNSLLDEGKLDDLSAILATIDRSFLLRSPIQNPFLPWYALERLVTFLTNGDEFQILKEMSHFLSKLPEMDLVSSLTGPQLLVVEFLAHIIPNLPISFTVPLELDLSPALALCVKHSCLQQYSETLIYFLDREGLEVLSDWHPARKLWEFCRRAWERGDCSRRPIMANFYLRYQPCFIREPSIAFSEPFLTFHEALPVLSDEECHHLSATISGLIHPIAGIQSRSVISVKRSMVELLDLDERQRNNVASHILLRVQRSDFVAMVMLLDLQFDWTQIEDLVTFIAKGHETEILADLVTHQLAFGSNHAAYLFLDFLAHLEPSLPPAFTVPDSFNLTGLFRQLDIRKPGLRNWRKYSDTIIFYLDHGAAKILDDPNICLSFFALCTQRSRRTHWQGSDDEEATSDPTLERAEFYWRNPSARGATYKARLSRLVHPFDRSSRYSVSRNRGHSLSSLSLERIVSPQSTFQHGIAALPAASSSELDVPGQRTVQFQPAPMWKRLAHRFASWKWIQILTEDAWRSPIPQSDRLDMELGTRSTAHERMK